MYAETVSPKETKNDNNFKINTIVRTVAFNDID